MFLRIDIRYYVVYIYKHREISISHTRKIARFIIKAIIAIYTKIFAINDTYMQWHAKVTR